LVSSRKHAIAITPVDRWGLSLSRVPPRRPSPLNCRVGVHVKCFEACSAFTRVTACLLAGSLNDPFHRRLRRFRYLHRRSDCYRLERPVAGWDSNPLKTNTLHNAQLNATLEGQPNATKP
jgi:hypothetical protein